MNTIELIISIVTSAFAGGWVTRVLTIRQSRRKAEAEAAKAAAEADKQSSDNWREFGEKMERRLNAMEAKVQAQTEVIMMTFSCRLLSQNPEIGCPVQKAFHQLREEDGGEEND